MKECLWNFNVILRKNCNFASWKAAPIVKWIERRFPKRMFFQTMQR